MKGKKTAKVTFNFQGGNSMMKKGISFLIATVMLLSCSMSVSANGINNYQDILVNPYFEADNFIVDNAPIDIDSHSVHSSSRTDTNSAYGEYEAIEMSSPVQIVPTPYDNRQVRIQNGGLLLFQFDAQAGGLYAITFTNSLFSDTLRGWFDISIWCGLTFNELWWTHVGQADILFSENFRLHWTGPYIVRIQPLGTHSFLGNYRFKINPNNGVPDFHNGAAYHQIHTTVQNYVNPPTRTGGPNFPYESIICMVQLGVDLTTATRFFTLMPRSAAGRGRTRQEAINNVYDFWINSGMGLRVWGNNPPISRTLPPAL